MMNANKRMERTGGDGEVFIERAGPPVAHAQRWAERTTVRVTQAIALLVTLLSTGIALGDTALEEYVRTARWGTEAGTLSSIWYSIPTRVFDELADNSRLPMTLRFLTGEASSGRREHTAQQMIVLAFYIFLRGKGIHDEVQTKNDVTSISVPRVFYNALATGFPRSADGWDDWLDGVLPKSRVYRK